jgi:hypothetical protein
MIYDFLHKEKISEFKMVEFVSDRMLHKILEGRWFQIIFERSSSNRV